ncbi:MAG: phosphoribosylanthranilate isomerase [Phycisphaerae bacterium]|nr:phosphoribosylanthranilate isomerase [Phycisphaerae bacterium]
MSVKIEGLRDPATALRVARMGAEAIGLVFAASPRQVSPAEARAVVEAMPPQVATVGVFVNEDAEAINRIISHARIRYVQLHGDEPPEMLARVKAQCIKAFRIRGAGSIDEIRSWLEAVPQSKPNLAAVLLDAYDPHARGGTGRQFNWQLLADAMAAGELPGGYPIILAGGLNASNVRRAVEIVRPRAVDVASGVESAPGVKDLDKVAAFIDAVREFGGTKNDSWL